MKSILTVAMLAGAGLLCAAPVLEVKKVADFQIPSWQAKAFSDTVEGAIKAESPRSVSVQSKSKVNVDMNKSYKVTGKARKAPGATEDTFFWFGIVPYNAEGKQIVSAAVNFSLENMTELAAPAKKGDRELVVKDASKWKMRGGYEVAAFNAKADGSDIPNQDVSPIISKIEKRGDHWVLSLKEPLKKDYPAGTVVRNQRHGANYHYFIAQNAPNEWQEFSRTIKGDAGKKGQEEKMWWPGTRSVGLIFFTQKGTQIEIRDLAIIEL